MAGKRLDQATKNKIRKLVASGKTPNEVARTLNIGWQAVKRWADEPPPVTRVAAHVPKEGPGSLEEPTLRVAKAVKPVVRKFDPVLLAKLVQRHKDGESVKELAAEAGIKPSRIYQYTNASGQARLNGLLHAGD